MAQDPQAAAMGGVGNPDKQATFVTGLNQDKGPSGAPNENSNEFEKLRQITAPLNELVDQIDVQFERVLQNHEKDFKAAYEGHMTKVKKELIYLRDKAVEAAG